MTLLVEAEPPLAAAGASPAAHKHPVARRRRSPQPALSMPIGILIACGVLALWALTYGLFLSGLQEHSAQRSLYAQFRLDLAQETAPLGGIITVGEPVALLSIPMAGVHDVVVAEGSTSDVTEDGPGHLRDTPLPGQPGISVIVGRSVTFGAPFRHITRLSPGSKIQITTQQGPFTYVVADVRHVGDPVPTALTNGGRLTMVTSEATGWLSGWGASRTVYVDAVLQGNGQAPPPSPRLGNVADDELPLHADTSALILVVLGLQALLLAVGGAVWVASRWSAVQAWTVGLPVVLGALWFVTEHAAQLLPNIV